MLTPLTIVPCCWQRKPKRHQEQKSWTFLFLVSPPPGLQVSSSPLQASLLEREVGEKESILVCYGCQTKYHKVGGLSNRDVLLPSSGGWKLKIKVFTGFVPPAGCEENLLPASCPPSGGLMAIFVLHLVDRHITPISAFMFTWCVCLQNFPVYKDKVILN